MVRILHVNDQVRLVPHGFKEIEARISLGSIHINSILVEAIYHTERHSQWFPISVNLEYQLETACGEYLYRGIIPDHLIHGPHYLVRVRPNHSEFVNTFEMPLVTQT